HLAQAGVDRATAAGRDGQMRLRGDQRHETGAPPKIRVALWPPKPKELDSTGFGSTARAMPATTSIASAGSVSWWLAVGGTTRCCRASSDATASVAPAAPIRWPVTPLVDVTGTVRSPVTLTCASGSAASVRRVDVPFRA